MAIDYFKEFVKSKLHMYFGGICLGLTILSGNWFILILCAVVYGLGLAFIHELPFFQKNIDAKYQVILDANQAKEVEKFKVNRDNQLSALTKSRRDKYLTLASVCKEIEKATKEQNNNEDDASSMRLRKLDELMFTYLKLLTIEQTLEIFIQSEKDDAVSDDIASTQKTIDDVNKDLEKLQGNPTATKIIEGKQRLLISYNDRLDAIKKRVEKYEQAKVNLQLVSAEQMRLSEQIKLLRADTIASRNAESISTRIDASVSHLDETNKWLSEINEFKDVVGEIPQSSTRIGFEANTQTNFGKTENELYLNKDNFVEYINDADTRKKVRRKTYE
jgi:rRNA-processing protein FCF1